MVKLNKIYTRTGDDGTTGLGTGERRLKSDLRTDAYGTVDETNACIGMARVHTATTHPSIDAMRPSCTPTSQEPTPWGVMTRPPRITRSSTRRA